LDKRFGEPSYQLFDRLVGAQQDQCRYRKPIALGGKKGVGVCHKRVDSLRNETRESRFDFAWGARIERHQTHPQNTRCIDSEDATLIGKIELSI
jgi:hypothetical protein